MKFSLNRICVAALVLVGFAGASQAVLGPSYSLDDNPALPITSPPGWIPGFGAEDPFGIGLVLPALAPSPTLGAVPAMDADILIPDPAGGPLPVVDLPISPLGNGQFGYVDAVSDNKYRLKPARELIMAFSVDRKSQGLNATDVQKQFSLNQQPGDIFRSVAAFIHPGQFVQMAPTTMGYNGPLPTAGSGPPANLLVFDESRLMLTAGNMPGNYVGPSVMCPPIMTATHDNVDASNWHRFDVNPADRLTDKLTFLSVNPDDRSNSTFGPADIVGIWPNSPPMAAFMYAQYMTMGLQDFVEEGDDIDALVVWDAGFDQAEMAEPMVDFALFSLSPGSLSLQQYGLSEADVFFTNFTGAFWLYTQASDKGLMWFGPQEHGDNVDALEVMLQGDIDLDGDVDIFDFLILKANYGTASGASWMMGDLDGDGDVDIFDFLILKAHYGQTT